MAQMMLKGQRVKYTVRESRRARRIRIRMDVKRGLEIVYPSGVHQPAPDELLLQNQAWVLATMKKLQANQNRRFQRQYVQGAIFQYLGDDVTLNLLQSSGRKQPQVQLAGRRLDVSLPRPGASSDAAVIQAAIEDFYRQQAKLYLPQRTREIAEPLGFEYERVRIKNQKTRWGSCSIKRNLNFNLRLMMAPPDAIDYIIVHELCHLVHMNHSKAFWALVAKHCPNYNVWRQGFKQNSRYLVF